VLKKYVSSGVRSGQIMWIFDSQGQWLLKGKKNNNSGKSVLVILEPKGNNKEKKSGGPEKL
jgi:hypothetical protein